MIVKSIRPEVLTATRTAYWLAIDGAPEEQLVFIDKSATSSPIVKSAQARRGDPAVCA